MVITLENIKEILKTSGLPVAYGFFPEDAAPDLPILVYQSVYSNNFSADNVVYKKFDHIQIDLYTKLKDPLTEGKVEKALSSFYWEKARNTTIRKKRIESFMKLRCKKWQEKTRLNLVLKMCITRY